MPIEFGWFYRFWTLISMIAIVLLVCPQASSQIPSEYSKDRLDLAQIELLQSSMEADSILNGSVKELLKLSYEQARKDLKQADLYRAKAATLLLIFQTGRDETSTLKRRLENLEQSNASIANAGDQDAEQLQNELESLRFEIANQENALRDLSSELETLKQQPIEVSARLPSVRDELSETLESLQSLQDSEQSPGITAKRVATQAVEIRLRAELELLSQKRQSQAIHEDLVRAKRNLIRAQVQRSQTDVDLLASNINSILAKEATELAEEARRRNQEFDTNDESTKKLAEEVKELATDIEGVVSELLLVSNEENLIRKRMERLARDYEFVRQQLELGGNLEGEALSLFEIQTRLPDQAKLTQTTAEITRKIMTTRLASLNTEAKLFDHPELVDSFKNSNSKGVTELLETRENLLKQLDSNYLALARSQSALRFEAMEYANRVTEIREFVFEQMFWVKSSSPLNRKVFSDFPKSLSWLATPLRIQELYSSIWKALKNETLLFALYALSFVGLIFRRQHYFALLADTQNKVRRISTDRYHLTLKAVYVSILIALPPIIATGFLIWVINENPNASPWLQSVGHALNICIWAVISLSLQNVFCWKNGLVVGHFGWNQAFTAHLKKIALVSALVIIPLVFISVSTRYANDRSIFDSLGRFSFITLEFFVAFLLWWLLRSDKTVLVERIRHSGHPALAHWRKAFLSLAIGSNVILIALACTGRLATAIHLGLEEIATLFTITGSILLYYLVLRWFQVKERKLALAEALEKRRARSMPKENDEASNLDESNVTIEEPEEADLDSISEQTRHLLSTLFFISTVIAIGYLWSESIPVVQTLENIHLVGELTLLKIAKAILIGSFGYIAFRDLPALLELGVLRTSSLSPGTRSAISTLCQYLVVAITLAGIFHNLQIDWSKFGWIAAALSVGIGFGLQEIVANFVCGLILLFELPVRVGDIVTVDGQTGTVARIRMRATTIINWDRQELVVPNKAFITGALLNWTLSNSVNRVIVTVGIAYGCDTEKARSILLDTANNHPTVLDDPPPVASFEEFSESCLTLRLRVYLPNLENRIQIITELHSEVDRRFKEAGLEIAFPQRDLNIRSWPDLKASSVSSNANSPKKA